MSTSTPMPSADGADVRMIPSSAHLLQTTGKQQLKVQPQKSGRTATKVADVCKECVIHMAVSKLGCTEFPLGKPGDISTLFVKAVCGSNTGLAGLSLLPSRRDLDHSHDEGRDAFIGRAGHVADHGAGRLPSRFRVHQR
jgi:hypothetical protein